MKAIDLYNTTKIAYYTNVMSTNAKAIITLAQFKERYSKENGTRIQPLRNYAKAYGFPFKELKAKKLGGFTMSSSAPTKSCAADAIFNNILCVDFDHVTQDDCQGLAKCLWLRKDVIMLTKSVSGEGLYCLVSVSHHVSRLKECLECFRDDLPIIYRKYVDEKCSNPNRFRFDADFQQIWKPDDYEVEPFRRCKPVEFKLTNFRTKSNTSTLYKNEEDETTKDLKNVERIIKRMLACSSLCVYDYNDWYVLLKQVYGAFGESGEDYARQLSMSAPNYDERAFSTKWKRVCSESSNGLNMGYWVNIAKTMKNL